MKKNKIVYIKTEHIHPHPENPRKKLGDLTELAESIRKKGIMQNLTVIPIEDKPGEYMAIIGHRRQAAAKIAGVLEVPCQIIEGMTKKEQVSTMLEENMQRSDLTVYEQSQGFQMMLDLGETETTISEKTGFSKATIRHRLNLTKLDQEELKKKVQDESFQMTLTDMYHLEKVEDLKTRNKILMEAKNSKELIWKAQSAVYDAIKAKNTKKIIDILKELGVKKAPKNAETEQYTGKWETVKEISLSDNVPKEIKLPEGEDAVYYLILYRDIRVIKKAKKKELTPEEIALNKKKEDRKEIKCKMMEMDEKRKIFIHNIISGKIKAIKNENDVRQKAWSYLIEARSFLTSSTIGNMFTEKEYHKCTEEEKVEIDNKVKNLSLTHSMLVALHFSVVNIGDIYDYEGVYRPVVGEAIMHAYEALKPYGWTFANEDQVKLLNGTHELFVKKEA